MQSSGTKNVRIYLINIPVKPILYPERLVDNADFMNFICIKQFH